MHEMSVRCVDWALRLYLYLVSAQIDLLNIDPDNPDTHTFVSDRLFVAETSNSVWIRPSPYMLEVWGIV